MSTHKTNQVLVHWGLFLIFLLQLSCTSELNDASSTDPESEKLQGLEFTMPYDASGSSESRVSEVRFMAFRVDNGQCEYNALLQFNGNTDPSIQAQDQKATSDVVKLAKHRYHFLFIANETSAILSEEFREKIRQVGNLSQVYESSPFKDQAYSGVLASDQTIPMSAYYADLDISNSSADQPFSMPVQLVRALAKVVVQVKNEQVDNPTFRRIDKLELSHIASKYNIPALPGFYSDLYGEDETQTISSKEPPFEDADYMNEEIGEVVFYIPEMLNQESSSKNALLKISGKNFLDRQQEVYHENIVESYDEQPRRSKIESLDESSVLRNTTYQYVVKLTPHGLESELKVLPWTLIDSDKNFTKPKWDVFEILVGGSPENMRPHSLDEQEVPVHSFEEIWVKFKLSKPEGGEWKASLTNGRDFRFLANEHGFDGLAYIIKVEPSSIWNGSFKYTEFYIAVNGEELKLWNESDGPGNRYVFKQME